MVKRDKWYHKAGFSIPVTLAPCCQMKKNLIIVLVSFQFRCLQNLWRSTKFMSTRAGVWKTLCPQLPDSNTAWLQHCLPMKVTTVQIYEISMLFYQREIIYSKVNQVVYSSLQIHSPHFMALALTFEIFCWQGKNAQNHKGPLLMKYFSEFLQKLIRSSTHHYKSIY